VDAIPLELPQAHKSHLFKKLFPLTEGPEIEPFDFHRENNDLAFLSGKVPPSAFNLPPSTFPRSSPLKTALQAAYRSR
jgi:hypothetical protein